MRRSSVGLALALFVAASAASAAGPDRKSCLAAADDGQRLRDEGKLTAAREKFITCASQSCPGVVAKECNQWLQDAERDMPSVTFRVRDERGKEILDVRVLVDDQAVAESIDARALPVDPGQHTFRFERSDGSAVEDKVILRPAEKNRLIELSFEPAKETRTTPPADTSDAAATNASEGAPTRGFHIPILGWVGAGVAIAGAGMTALFAVQANDEEDRLRTTCAPTCSESDRDSIDSKLLLANVGLGVAVAGVGLAVVSTVLANSGAKAPPKSGRILPGIAPNRGGASFGLVGSF
jgi:hypothetical protein